MPNFKVINPDTPEEIDLVQDIPLVDEETGSDQIDSEGNILVKRYVTRSVSLNGINDVKNSLPQIKENAKNLKDLYDYSHSVNTDQQNQILENSSKITELLTDTTALEVSVTELENKIKGIQGIDIDDVKADLDALKQSAYLITGGILRGDISVQTPHTATVTLNPSGSSSSASFSCTNDMLECTSTWGKLFKQSEEGGFFYGLSSTALADKNGKELTNYISDIMGSNAQLTFIKGDGTSQVISINNVISATKATQDGNGDVIANTYIKSINGVKADANGNLEITASGLEIGDIGLAPLGIDETDNCRRYLNGQVILQSQFSKFTEKLKHAITLYPNLSTTEANWQSAVNLSPLGQCGKFVIDDEAGTIRLPKVVNVMGALDLSTIGQTVEAGLPNITGDLESTGRGTGSGFVSSTTVLPFTYGADPAPSTSGASYINAFRYNFNASNSNSIYGNSSTVQQEAIKYPYFIQVATSNNEDVQIDTQVRLNNPFSLFMPYWSPIELNNLSWLRSNKQWNNGSVYTSAYEFLLSKYNAGTEKTETIKGVSVTYKLADNGMKIITDKSKYDELISASGSAWFFVLDTENTQFILPYTNGFAQFGDELGKFTEAGLPNITGELGLVTGGIYVASGAFSFNSKPYSHISSSVVANADRGVDFSASNSSLIYGNSDTVQPNSVTGYLYFYIGEVEQDANIIATSGLATDIANLKSSVVRSVNGVDADANGNVTITLDNTVSIKSTRSSSGSWTITGLTVGKPLYVINSPKNSGGGCVCSIRATSGTLDISNVVGSWIGYNEDRVTNVFIVIPTSTTVVFIIDSADDDDYLRAYQ